MANKRTYINADEELIIQGKLTIEGDFEQREYVTNRVVDQTLFEGETLIINSDGVDEQNANTDATLALISGTDRANIVFSSTNNSLTFSGPSAVNFGSVPITAPSISDGTATLTGGNLTGAINITASGTITGGTLTDGTASLSGGIITGALSGTFSSTVTAGIFTDNTLTITAGDITNADSITANTFTGDLTGNVTGNVTGNLTGDVTGDVTGNLTGDVTGNLTGDVTGNLTGDVTGQVSDISNHDTSDLAEDPAATVSSGTMYYTDARSRSAVSVTDTGGDGSLTYNASTGVFTYTGPSASEARAHLSATDAGGDGSFSYNSSTGVFTYTGPSPSEVRAHFSVTDSGGDGSFAYNSTTGVYTYTGPSATEVRAHFTGGDGIDLVTGDIAVDTTVVRTSGNQSIAGDKTFTGTVDLSGASVPGFTVDGELSVTGNVNSLNYVDLQVQNSEIILNSNVATAQDAVIKNERGSTGNDTYLQWDEGSSRWQFSNDGVSDHNMLVFTDFSAVDAGGDGSFSYANGVYTYTGPSASEARAHFSGGDGIDLANGVIDVDSTVVRTSGAQTIEGEKTFRNPTKIVLAGAVPAHDIGLEVDTNNAVDALVVKGTGGYDNDPNFILTTTGNGHQSPGNGLGTLWFGSYHTGWNQQALLAGIHTDAGSTSGGFPTSGGKMYLWSGVQNFGGSTNAPPMPTIEGNEAILINGQSVKISAAYTLPTADGNANEVLATNGSGQLSFVRQVDLTSNQTIAGTKTFTGELIPPSSSSTTVGAIYYDNSLGEAYIYLNGSARKITPAVDAGDVEDVGTTGTNIYAGTRIDGSTTYHGIKSIDGGTYTTVSESANVITVDGDVSAIRGAFSGSSGVNYDSATGAITADSAEIRGLISANDAGGDGSFSYNSTTGVFTYTGPSASETRAHFSAGSGITLVNGVISATGDNYGSWTVQTDSGAPSSESISSGEVLTLQGGTNITVTNTGNIVTITNDNSADITGVGAGNGLTGGGNSGTVTLDVVGGFGITANANNVEITTSEVRGLFSASGDLSYDSGTGAFSYTTPTTIASLSNHDTDDLAEGAVNEYFTTARARSSVSASGDLSYSSATGVFSFTERTDAEVRGLFSVASPLTYNSSTGEFGISEVGDISAVSAGLGLTGGGTQGAVTLNVGAGTGITVAADSVAVDMSAFDTGDLAEGSNLYYTATRANDAIDTRVTKSFVDALNVSAGSASQVNVTEENTNVSTQRLVFHGGDGSGNKALRHDDDLTYVPSTNTMSVGNISVSGSITGGALTVSNFSSAAIQTGSESFTDTDVMLMTAAAVNDRILSFGYTTNVGDITGVTAGTNLNGGGTTGTPTINLDTTLTGMTAATFSGTVTANLFSGTATSARYADLAEKYTSDVVYPAGTVVVFGGVKEITHCTNENSHKVAGIISTDPAYMMNSEADGQYVALRGRVPCMVVGKVLKGDVLITSSTPGHAMASDQPHFVGAACIVGKAISSKDTDGPGIVEVLV